MTQLCCDARNIRHMIDGDGTLVTLIEAIITVQSRQMIFAGASMVQSDTMDTHRFEMGIESAKTLVEDMQRWIKDAEEEHAKISVSFT